MTRRWYEPRWLRWDPPFQMFWGALSWLLVKIVVGSYSIWKRALDKLRRRREAGTL